MCDGEISICVSESNIVGHSQMRNSCPENKHTRIIYVELCNLRVLIIICFLLLAMYITYYNQLKNLYATFPLVVKCDLLRGDSENSHNHKTNEQGLRYS